MTQKITPSYDMKYAFKIFDATCTVTPFEDILSWRVEAAVGGSGWFNGYIVFKVIVISGSYDNGHIDAEVTCYAGSDAVEQIRVDDSNPATFSGPDPTLTNAGDFESLAIGETKWLNGNGGLVYQTGYFSVSAQGDYQTGMSVDAYFRLDKLRWSDGNVIIWDREDDPGYPQNNDIFTSGIQLGSRATEIISTTGVQLGTGQTEEIFTSGVRHG